MEHSPHNVQHCDYLHSMHNVFQVSRVSVCICSTCFSGHFAFTCHTYMCKYTWLEILDNEWTSASEQGERNMCYTEYVLHLDARHGTIGPDMCEKSVAGAFTLAFQCELRTSPAKPGHRRTTYNDHRSGNMSKVSSTETLKGHREKKY